MIIINLQDIQSILYPKDNSPTDTSASVPSFKQLKILGGVWYMCLKTRVLLFENICGNTCA